MTSIYIHCPLLSEEDYRKILEQLCSQSVRNATIFMHAEGICPKQLKILMEVQQDFGLQRPIRFRNVLVLSQIPSITRSVRRVLRKHSISLHLEVSVNQASKLVRPARTLAKHGISCKLWVDADKDQFAVYDKFCALGLPLNFQRPRYTADTADRFSRWLYEPQAQGINTFCDIITMLTLDTRSPNCRYASCFGSTYRVDEQFQVYLCPYHMDARTCLGDLNEPEQLLQAQSVTQLLPQIITRREQCANSCSSFSHCQGGCLLQPPSEEDCAHYITTVDRIRQALLEVYRSGNLNTINPIVNNAILNALAFGTAFFR